jgi:hypothetical protein
MVLGRTRGEIVHAQLRSAAYSVVASCERERHRRTTPLNASAWTFVIRVSTPRFRPSRLRQRRSTDKDRNRLAPEFRLKTNGGFCVQLGRHHRRV